MLKTGFELYNYLLVTFLSRGFESRRRILDGHFFTLISYKIVMMFV